MRRCLLIAAFLLLTAPAAALADGVVTTKLSSTPDSVKTGKPWKEDAGLMEFLRTL